MRQRIGSAVGRCGAFVTSCICHGCPWTGIDKGGGLVAGPQNRTAKQHYEEWYSGAAEPAGGWVAVDARGPNGDGNGKAKGQFKYCATFP